MDTRTQVLNLFGREPPGSGGRPTYTQVGEQVGITASRVGQIVRQAIADGDLNIPLLREPYRMTKPKKEPLARPSRGQKEFLLLGVPVRRSVRDAFWQQTTQDGLSGSVGARIALLVERYLQHRGVRAGTSARTGRCACCGKTFSYLTVGRPRKHCGPTCLAESNRRRAREYWRKVMRARRAAAGLDKEEVNVD